jgi:hypothetical protein
LAFFAPDFWPLFCDLFATLFVIYSAPFFGSSGPLVRGFHLAFLWLCLALYGFWPFHLREYLGRSGFVRCASGMSSGFLFMVPVRVGLMSLSVRVGFIVLRFWPLLCHLCPFMVLWFPLPVPVPMVLALPSVIGSMLDRGIPAAI